MSNLKTKPEKSFTPGSLKSPSDSYPNPQEYAKDWSPSGNSGRHQDEANTGKGVGPRTLPEAGGQRPGPGDAPQGKSGIGDGKSHSGQGQKGASGDSDSGGYG